MAHRLGVGFIGSGFNARFHIQSFTGVRDADVRGVWSPNAKNAKATADLANQIGVGEARAYRSIAEMVADPAIDAIWLCGPNQARIENVEEIVKAIRGGAALRGLACEKPLARNVAEAKKVAKLAASVGLNTGYLENQLFAPDITRGKELIWARGAALTGRPYLARAAEEHSGPHMPWFWQASLQGGGVLNDMMCHSVEVVRHLLTKPGEKRSSIRPVRITGHIASLKWTRPEYSKRLSAAMGKDVDYRKRPSEDFARATIEYEADSGERMIGEVTTSWSFVGAGLRLSAELLGPEYSMSWNTLDSGLKLFFSREVKGKAGEDLVEKQNAETGQMPVIADEAAAYGYTNENRHFVRAFLRGERGMLTFEDGVEVMQILMTAYMSAEQGRTLEFPPRGLDAFSPEVARGKWQPGKKD
jgi:predicted dehydrogenase